MKLSIRGRVLLLVLSGVLATLFAVGMVSFYSFYVSKKAASEQERAMGEFLSESMGGYAEEYAKARLKEVTEAKARHLDREFYIIGEDVEYMSDSMSRILSSPGNYLPRVLPDTRGGPDILSGTPYVHYSPELMRQGIGKDLQAEIGLAGNFADVLVPMSKFYHGVNTFFFAGSKHGYFLCLDSISSKNGPAGIFPSPEARQDFLDSFDPRQRPWYRLGKDAARPVFTGIYMATEGYPGISCVMPYYDDDGFAGVVGISYSVEDIHQMVAEVTLELSRSSFVLDRKGDVVFSTERDGILAAVPENLDIREMAEPSLAEAAQHMTAGESGVMSVELEGDTYYLAFAPMKSIGWSFGIVIEDDEVLDPVEQVSSDVLEKVNHFHGTLKGIFKESLLQMGMILVPVLLLVIYGSGSMAARVTRPIRRLADGVREIASGNFDKKLDLHTGDEIEHLATCFNSMAEDLKAYTENLARAAAEKERAQAEMEVAARIQSDMVPGVFPAFPERKEFDIYAMMEPAKDVGGDFYDFYLRDEDLLAFAIADVSGKGIPAALFMAKSQSILKQCLLTAKDSGQLASVLEHANEQLCRNNDSAMFVTVFLGVLDLRTGHLVYADGGHCPPLLGRGGHYDFLPMRKGTMLGLMELPYEQQSVDLAPGDTIFLYTDGVSEAMNENGEQFSEPRIKAALNDLPPDRNPEDILSCLLKSIKQHAGSAEQSDDITMLGLRYNGK